MTTPLFQLSNPTTIHAPTGYSHLAEVRRGRLIYIAGQVGQDPSGAVVGTDLRTQATQVFTNLKAAVESAGGTFASIFKLGVFCAERVAASDLLIYREVRDQFVSPQARPVSTLVFVSRLARPEWLIEIEAVAVIDGDAP
jgi:enamine deaminase RidA (YjgF/YER057c/UK114 family)